MVRLQPGGKVPGVPIVVRNAAETSIARATAIRSWLRINLLTAATISGVRPAQIAASAPRQHRVG